MANLVVGAGTEAAAADRSEIVFIDSGVTGYQALAEATRAGMEVVILSAGRDGLVQISEILAERGVFDAIHVVSHGAPGSVLLGSADINLASLDDHQAELASIARALSGEGELLLYGCDVAAGAAGQVFIDALSQAIGATVAASTDLTGSAAQSGDLVLEYSTGSITAHAPFAWSDEVEALGVWTKTTVSPNPPGDAYGSGNYVGQEVASGLTVGGFTLTWNGYAEEDSHSLWFGTHWEGQVGAGFQRNPYGADNTEIAIERTDGSEFWLRDFKISNMFDGSETWTFTGYRDGAEISSVTVSGLQNGDNTVVITDPNFANVDKVVVTSVEPFRGGSFAFSHSAPVTGDAGALLSPGDIAVIGLDATTYDAAFIATNDLPGDHFIFFTTTGWDSTASAWVDPNYGLLGVGEQTLMWKTPSAGVAAGTVFHLTDIVGDVSDAGLPFNTGAGPQFAIRDQISIFEVPAGGSAHDPSFVYAVNLTDETTAANGFHTSFTDGDGYAFWAEGGVPSGLTAAADGGLGTAFGLIPDGTKAALKSGVLQDGMSRDELLRAIHTAANWESSTYDQDDGSYDFAARFADITLGSSNAVPSATNLTQSKLVNEGGAAVALDNIEVTDADPGDTIIATLTLSHPDAGSLSTGIFGSATSSFSLGVWTVSGTAADVNAALAAVAFNPAADWDQDVTITTRIRDAAGAGPADGAIILDVTAVNDAPTATNLTQSKTLSEGGSTVALDDVVVSDVDTDETITATLTMSQPAGGALSVGTFGSATSTFNAGTGVWSVTGSVADVNAALAAVALTPSADSDQNFTIATRVRDASGVGPADGVISVTVTSANDAPTATNLTHTVTYAEDPGAGVPLVDISVTDPDLGDTITATLVLSAPQAGTLSVGTYGSATATYDAANGVWTVSGTATDVNAALAATTFMPVTDWDQDVTITTRIRDAAGAGPADGVITLDVTPVNDAPTDDAANGFVNAGVATETGGLAVIGAALLHDGDVDDAGAGVTYTVSAGPGAGTLFLDANGDGGVDGGEALTTSSTFTQADLDAGRLKYLHGGGVGSSDSFGFSLADGGEDGAAALTGQSFSISIAERPIITIGGGTPAFAEDGAAVAIAPNLIVTDGDSATLAGATVSITDLVAGDVLGFDAQDGISGSYDAGAGVLTLSGAATSAQYQAALRSITYSSTSDNPASTAGGGDRTISFAVDDGGLTSTTQAVTVAVTGANDAPTATNLDQTAPYLEDPPGGVALGDIVVSDPDVGETLTATLGLSDPAAGTLSTGTFGAATSTYNAGTGVWSVTGAVADVNAALAAVTFTPAAGWDQDVTITTRVRDAAGAGPADGVIALDVTSVNDAPTGSVSISGVATQGQILTASHTLADADGLGAVSYQWKAGGIAIAGANQATFTLTQDEVGKAITVTASYTDGGGHAESLTSVATSAVANVNDAPTGTVNISGSAYVNQTLTASNTLADVDGLDPASIVYQWQAGDVDIPGANQATLLLDPHHLGKKITVIASYTDEGGHAESVESAATALVANTPAPQPDPEPQPPAQTVTVDGVQVGASTTTNPDGSTSTVITIPTVTPSRAESVGGNTVADIPLVRDGSGATLLHAQVPTGFGLEVRGMSGPKGAGSALTDLIREIRAHTQAGSTDQASLTSGGSGFLGALASETPLLVQTIVPRFAPTSTPGSEPLVIAGQPTAPGGAMTALVIDARGLPSGAEIQLQNVEFAAISGGVRLTGGEGAQIVWGDGHSQYMVLGAEDDELHGGGGDDTIGSKTGQDRLYGDEGRDTVFGGEDNDQVSGGADADNVHGNQGDDFVHGNQGDDTILGGQGDDLVFGGKGADLAFGDNGNDQVFGDFGADTLHGGDGADTMTGGDGHDRLEDLADLMFGGSGDDQLSGERGGDTLQGNQGRDALFGGDGDDLLLGGQDADAIRGDAGDDFIWGDLGSDTLSGGSGADRFGFRQGEGADVITDFAFAEGDRIVLDWQQAPGWTVSSTAGGDAVLNFAGGGSVVLQGVTSADVTQAWFV